MADWHGYIAIEDVNLTTEQRAAVIAAFNALGPVRDPQPAHLLARRVSLDGSIALFEALFNEDSLTAGNVRAFLANAVGINPELIDYSVSYNARGALVVYSVASVTRMRFLQFARQAGYMPTWDESRDQADIYVINNIGEW